MYFGLLSLPDLAADRCGRRRASHGRQPYRVRSLGGAHRVARHLRGIAAARGRLRQLNGGFPVRREDAVDPGIRRVLRARRRRHRAAADHPHHADHRACARGGVDGHRAASRAVLRRLPDHGRSDDRRVQRHGRAAVLLLLGSDADPDVPHHRNLGWPAPRVRDDQVLPVHVPRLRLHAGRAHLHVRRRRATTASAASSRCRSR